MTNTAHTRVHVATRAPVATGPDTLAVRPQLVDAFASPDTAASLTEPRPLAAERMIGFPASPGARPFGGASHTRPAGIQAKLSVSQPGDPFEQEADRVSETILRMAEPAIQRQDCPTCDDERENELIQRQVAAPVASQATSALSAVPQGGGEALPGPVRDFFGSRFSAAGGSVHDFSRVRIHTGPQADAAADAIHARAYTLGHDIVFAAGEYAPHTDAGRRLLGARADPRHPAASGRAQRDPPGSSGSSGPSVSMPSMTSLLFRYGDLRLQANLPTEVVATLPGGAAQRRHADLLDDCGHPEQLFAGDHARHGAGRPHPHAGRLQPGDGEHDGGAGGPVRARPARSSATEVQGRLRARRQRATTALQNFLNPPAPTPLAPGESGPSCRRKSTGQSSWARPSVTCIARRRPQAQASGASCNRCGRSISVRASR